MKRKPWIPHAEARGSLLKRDIDAFCIYQWIERCHFHGWWELAFQLSTSVPSNLLSTDYHKRLEYILFECRKNVGPVNPISYPSDKIPRDELIPYIIAFLRNYGGRARKEEVETKIYKTLCNIFQQDWYQGHVSHGIPGWKHLLAWAKEEAKEKGLIKWPKESGRGYWELTSEGYHIELGNMIKGGSL